MNIIQGITSAGIFFSIIQALSASGHSAESSSVIKDSSRILALDEALSPQTQKEIDALTSSLRPSSSFYEGNYYQNMRPGRQLLNSGNSFSPASLLSLASAASSTNYGYGMNMNDIMPEYGEQAQSSGGGAGGWSAPPGPVGGGYGFNDGYHIIKEEPIVNYSAVGLLGFLALLSLIQNVLYQMSTTTAKPASSGGGRKKRSNDDDSQSRANELNRVTTLILPLLTAVAHTRDGLVPAYCTHREICNANAVLTKELGPQGRSLGSIITDAVSNLLTKDIKQSYKHLEGKIIRSAGKAGRSGDDCRALYKSCTQLRQLPTYSIPMSMLQNTEYSDEETDSP